MNSKSEHYNLNRKHIYIPAAAAGADGSGTGHQFTL